MAKYRVQGPDGAIHVFEGPADASPADVEAFAAKTFAAPSKQQPAAPFEDPGFAESTLIGAGRTFDRIIKGSQQLYYGATGNQAEQDKLKAAADEDTKYYKPLAEARPWATGIGEALPSMVVPAGGSATLLGNAGRMAVAGAAPGLLEYGSADERLTRGGLGAVGGAVTPALGAGAKAGWSLLEPLWEGGRKAIAGRTLNRAAEDAAPAVAARMGSARELVPGSAPTAAEVAQSGGIAALQRSASAANPEAYTTRALEQSNARLTALRGVAGDDATLAAAKKYRSDTAEKSYRNAFAAGVDQDMAQALKPQIDALMARPSIQKATAAAKELAAEDSINLTDMGSVQGLHYLKMALDDIVSEAVNNPKKQRLVAQTAKDLQSVLEDIAPEYKAATERYARNSAPINQMEVGRELLNAVQPALSDHGALGKEMKDRFALALRNSDQTAKRATGLNSASLESVLTPQQMRSVTGVAQDLARKTNAQDLGRGAGSDTFQKLSMNNIAQQSGMPGLTGGILGLPGISRATNWAYRDTDQKLQTLLANALLNPQQAAKLMTDADKKLLASSPVIRRLLEQSAVRGGGLLGLQGAGLLQQQP